MKINIGDTITFRTSTGIKEGRVYRKQYCAAYARVIFRKGSAKTYRVTTKDLVLESEKADSLYDKQNLYRGTTMPKSSKIKYY